MFICISTFKIMSILKHKYCQPTITMISSELCHIYSDHMGIAYSLIKIPNVCMRKKRVLFLSPHYLYSAHPINLYFKTIIQRICNCIYLNIISKVYIICILTTYVYLSDLYLKNNFLYRQSIIKIRYFFSILKLYNPYRKIKKDNAVVITFLYYMNCYLIKLTAHSFSERLLLVFNSLSKEHTFVEQLFYSTPDLQIRLQADYFSDSVLVVVMLLLYSCRDILIINLTSQCLTGT